MFGLLMEFHDITVQREEQLVFVQLDRPDAMNALSDRLLDELNRAMEALDKEEEIRAIILMGNGRNFCAGADLNEMRNWDKDEAAAISEKVGEITSFLETTAKITVAAVEGFCLGGGQELALACDFRIAAEGATFGQPEVRLGMIPGYGATARLTKLIGLARAKSMILSGKRISAEEADEIGLIDGMVSEGKLMQRTKTFVTDLVQRTSPLAYKRAKKLLRTTADLSIDEAVKRERDEFASMFDTYDRKEGIKAFLEERDPEFRGE
jgi:enoyl-CoA hydratase